MTMARMGPLLPECMAILIPWLNKLKYAKATLDSVRHQTSKNWTCFIRDDQSDDGVTEFVAKEVGGDPRFDIVRSYPGERLGVSMNTLALIDAADYEGFDIVGLLDCDDTLEPEAVDHVLKFYAQPPYKGFVYTQFVSSDSELRRRGRGLCQAIPEGRTFAEHRGGYVGHWETFRIQEYRKSVGINQAFDQGLDKHLAYAMEEVTKLWFLDEPLYWWRGWAEGSITANSHLRGVTARHTRGARLAAIIRRQSLPPNWMEERT